MFLRRLGRPGLFLQLLIPSLVAVVLCAGLVEAWTLRAGAQAMDEGALQNLKASMALLRAYLDPLGTEWSRVDGQLRLGTTAVADRMDIVDRAAAAAGGVATLFNGDERVATTVRRPDGTRAVGTRLTDPIVRDAVLSVGRPYQGRTSILGQEYVTIYEPIRDGNGNLIGVLFMGLPTAPLEAWKAEVGWHAVLAGALVTVVFAVLNGVLLVRTLRPLNGLAAATRRIAAGDLSSDIPSLGRHDQLGALAASLRVFKDAAQDKLRLEASSEEVRRQSELARMEHAAARAAAAEEQGTVVSAVAAGLERVAAGDLTVRLDQPFAAEYEALRGNFNTALSELQDAMRAIVANAHGVRTGTEEISQASDDLSRRTEQQAASLEQTAAALDEITATVRRTAEGARQAQDAVGRTKADAERSGEVVRQAMAAMSGIEQSSDQIGQIIGVVNEIAFQTNLLALNAGVEAARAGDAGRGFAVVASEVRALAQRSADAAREIKALIHTSTQQVGSGVKLVGETGETLARIVTEVAEAAVVVAEIAAAAGEQATGLLEVNTAVNQMDQVTQENAAMVEQSTAACRSLVHETEEMARLTGRFQVGEDMPASTVTALRRSSPRAAAVPAAKPVLRVVGRAGRAAGKLAPVTDGGWQEF
jgi:methyl-accepting chemotaxis protein